MMAIDQRCRVCGITKSTSEFHAEPRNVSGFRYDCKECHNAYVRQWKRDNPGYLKGKRNEWLKRAYNVDSDWYTKTLNAQEGMCAICKAKDPGHKMANFAVDHDHETGKVRSLLCNRCNIGLGRFRDDPELLLKAASYLKEHKK